MNKHTRLIVSLLFIVVILMAAAITRFYTSVPNGPAVIGNGDEITKVVETDKNGFSIFSDSSGFFGIAESGRIVAAAEWSELHFAGNDKCIAAKKIGSHTKFGCIDFEGNLTVPLIYKSIEEKTIDGISYYFAVSEENGSIVIYDEELMPCFPFVWDSYSVRNSELTLNDEKGKYIYSCGKEGFLLKSAAIKGNICNRPYELNIYSRVLLSKLTPAMIEKMASDSENYIDYAFTGNRSLIKKIGGDIRNFKKLFPDSEEIITKRLKSVPEMHIYSVGSEDGIPLYEVSVTAEAEIFYKNELGKNDIFVSRQKAAIRFRGNSDMELVPLSGEFEADYPEYPPVEEPTEAPTTEASTEAEGTSGTSETGTAVVSTETTAAVTDGTATSESPENPIVETTEVTAIVTTEAEVDYSETVPVEPNENYETFTIEPNNIDF